jgi:DNA mismatch repair ATPase MutS
MPPQIRQNLLEDHLKGIPDLAALMGRFQKGKASLQQIVTLYQTVIRLPTLQNTLDAYEGQFGDDIKSKFTTVCMYMYIYIFVCM